MTADPSGKQSGALLLVTIAIAGGLVAAFHMGKIPAALLVLKSEFNLDLLQSGLVVSSFSLLAAGFGVVLGALARRIGERVAGTAGLMATGAGALLGAAATGYPMLLGSRVLEGFGFLLVAVTMPGLINRVSPPATRAVALGIWGAFIPAAMSLMLLISPLTMGWYGWRGLWVLTACASILLGLVFVVVSSGRHAPITAGPFPARRPSLRGPLLVSLVFTGYSALFAAVTSFLPTYWADTRNLPLDTASHLASLVVIGNIAGNVSAGFLVSRGAALTRLLRVALLGGGLCASIVFAGMLPVAGEVAAAWMFTFFAGLLPGAVFAHIGAIAASPSAVSLTTGMIFQGAGLGQVVGPLGFSYSAGGSWGWAGGSAFLCAVSLVSVVLTSYLPARYKSHPVGT